MHSLSCAVQQPLYFIFCVSVRGGGMEVTEATVRPSRSGLLYSPGGGIGKVFKNIVFPIYCIFTYLISKISCIDYLYFQISEGEPMTPCPSLVSTLEFHALYTAYNASWERISLQGPQSTNTRNEIQEYDHWKWDKPVLTYTIWLILFFQINAAFRSVHWLKLRVQLLGTFLCHGKRLKKKKKKRKIIRENNK